MRTFDVHTPYAELDRQHNLLRTRLAALQEAASADSAVDGQELLQQVEAVRSSLALHFSFEENVGTFSFLLSAPPTLQAEGKRLRAEHAAFLTTLDQIAMGLRSGSGAPKVGGALLSVLDKLVDHELDERKLCRTALRSAPMRPRSYQG